MADITLPGSYISVGDFSQALTGIDSASLEPGELARAINRASRWVDKICRQTLYATVDTVQLLQDRSLDGYQISAADGLLYGFPKRFPIRSIVSLSQQYSSSDVAASLPLSQVHIDSTGRFFWVEGLWAPFRKQSPPMYLEFVYLNGWLATQLAAPAAAGQPVITLVPQPGQATVQGVSPGQQLEIQDAYPEIVTVLSASGNNVTLAQNLASTHVRDVMACELNYNDYSFADAQQATINLTSYLIKTKGVGPLVLKGDGVSAQVKSSPAGDLVEKAEDLLESFKVRW